MKAVFHRLVQTDVWAVMRHYTEVSGEKLTFSIESGALIFSSLCCAIIAVVHRLD